MPGSWSSSCPMTRGRGSCSLSWRRSGVSCYPWSRTHLPSMQQPASASAPQVAFWLCIPTSPLPPECLLHGVEEDLVVERLGQEVDGTHLHGAHGHRNVAVAGDEDHWDSTALVCQRLLQVEPAFPRHPDVHHEAAQTVEVPALQERARRRERLDPVASGPQQPFQAPADRGVVVNDADGRVALIHVDLPPAHGRVKWKVAPRVGLLATQMTPPWASMIDRLMESPMPRPAGFVV